MRDLLCIHDEHLSHGAGFPAPRGLQGKLAQSWLDRNRQSRSWAKLRSSASPTGPAFVFARASAMMPLASLLVSVSGARWAVSAANVVAASRDPRRRRGSALALAAETDPG